MKKISFLFISFFFSLLVSAQNDCLSDLYKKKVKPFKKHKIDSMYDEPAGVMRYTIDSLNYTVIKDYDVNNKLLREWIFNDDTGIGLIKEFYSNGKLSSTGYMTQSYIETGVWQFYSESGKHDSTMNYQHHKVSFCELYNIVKSKGLASRRTSYSADAANKTWIVQKWITTQKGAETYDGIEVDMKTGRITQIHEKVQELEKPD
jgi:hypothetical protein